LAVTLGCDPWLCRYDFTQGSALEQVAEFESRALPLDVMILDMNWHLKVERARPCEWST
jgi:hypothetical protein